MTYTYTKDRVNGIEVKNSAGEIIATITGSTPEFLKQALAAQELIKALSDSLFAMESVVYITGQKALIPYVEQARATLNNAKGE